MREILKYKAALFCAAIIVIIIILSAAGPFFIPYGKATQDLINRLTPPSASHWLGTDELGRDVLVRILYGTRASLIIAIIPTAAAIVSGTVLGIAAAWFGKWTDLFVVWLADVTLAFPGILLAMVVLYSFGGSMSSVILSIVIMEWGSVARIVRSVTLSLKEQEYITAARLTGVSRSRILIRHLLPNLSSTLIVLFTLNIPTSILSESTLSFLGIGVQPPDVSLGLMVSQSKAFLFQMPWLSLAPAGMIMILVLAFHFLGDALRDILDPETSYE